MKEIKFTITENLYKRLEKANKFYFEDSEINRSCRLMVETFIEYIEGEYPKKKTRKTNGVKNVESIRETKEPKPRRKRTSKAKVQ
jgi:hypothetical protein